MWLTLLLRSLKSGSTRRRPGYPARTSKNQRSRRVRLQLEMLEDRRVPSNVLPLFDPFGPGPLSDGFHAPDGLDHAAPNIVLTGNPGSPSTGFTGNSTTAAASSTGASSSSGNSGGSQASGITTSNSTVPNSPFLGAVANPSSAPANPASSNVGPSPNFIPSGAGPLSVTSINSTTTNISSGSDLGYSIGVQSDGKIVVAGLSNSSQAGGFDTGNCSIAVVRYNPDLTLDTTYGQNGIQTTQITAGNTNAGRAMVLQPTDGKAVVAGWTATGKRNTGYDNFAVARYTTSGALDTSFGGGKGYVTTDVAGALAGKSGYGSDHALAVTEDGSGRIIAVGYASPSNTADSPLALVRYNSNGTLDTSFDSTGTKPGIASLDLGSGIPTGISVAVDANGNYVVGGTMGANLFLARYTSAGVLDTTFGASSAIKGTVVMNLSPPGSGTTVNGIALDSSGRIVVVGRGTFNGSETGTMVARFNPDGALDTTFNGTGSQFVDFAGNGQAFYSVVIQSDGKIVAAGYANATPGGVPWSNYAVARFNPDGTLDTTFNGTGTLMYTFPNQGDASNGTNIMGQAVALNSTGTILVTGWTDAPTPHGSDNIGLLAVQP